MGISLTKILAGAGISTAANALFPGIGMADAFARTAGMGMGSGLMRTAVTPGGSGGQNRFGGPGSPQGAMPTRKFGSTRETVGELKSGFKDWLVDPLQAKKEKREQARDTALAVRLGITGGEYSLTHRPAMSLIKKRTGDVQTNLMILQFRVQQFMARNLSAIASTLGVSKSKIGHEQPDPNKSWFGQILSSLHKDLQQNPIFSTVESVGKHALNIGRILNPFTMGSRAKKGVKSFGEFMQRLAMGKEGFEMTKDKELLYEKAGLKQDFQTKSVNLMKINNEYQKHQLNMLYNILGATKEILGIFGGSYQNQMLDLTHDEFEGELKTHKQLQQAQGMRAMKAETTRQAATRKSFFGRVGSFVGGIRNIGYTITEIARPNQASKRDLYALDYMYNTPYFFDNEVRGVSDALDQFIDQLRGQNVDWYNKNNANLANQFKFLIERAIEHPKPGFERQARQLEESWELARQQSHVQVSIASSDNAASRVNNIFQNMTGISAANTDPLRGRRELRNQYETYTRFGGDLSMAGTVVGSGGERAVNEYHQSGILPAVLRSIPILGAFFGMRQQTQIGGLQNRYERAMRGGHEPLDYNQIFGYGQNAQGGQGGGGGSGGKPLFTMNVKIVDVSQNLITKIESTLNSVLTTFSLRFGAVLSNLVNTDFENVFLNVERQFVKDLFDKIEEWNKSKNRSKAIPIAEKQPPIRFAHGGALLGGNISNYSGKIVDKPTLFKSRGLQDFSKFTGLMGEAGPEGIFPLAKNKKGDYGISAPDIMRVILVDTSGKPLPISLPSSRSTLLQQPEEKKTAEPKIEKSDLKPLRASFESQISSLMSGSQTGKILRDLSLRKYYNENFVQKNPLLAFHGTAGKLSNLFSGMTGKSEDKKKIDENDNITTAAERQKNIEDRQEKKSEEKREEKQQVNEEDKKSTLHRIADLLDPRTAIGKLVDKYREHKQKKKDDGFKLPFDISSWVSKLGIGLIGNELLKMLPEGFFTGENGILSQIWKFTKDSVGKLFEKAKKYVEDNAFGWFQGAWEHFKEHPLLDAGILMTLFPGTVGKLLVKVAGKAIMNPASIPLIIGVGGMVYNLIDSFSKSKDENGEFSLWKFLKEFFIGSESNLGSIIGKAGTYGYIGLKIGLRFGPHGALLGSLIGGALGSFIGSINSKDENGDFSIGEFLKSFFLGKDSAGGLANGAGNAIKWGLVGAAIGVPFGGIGAIPGFLLGAALGGIIGGVTGYLGYDKLETGSTVSKLLKWKSGSFAHKLANFPGAQFPPFIGPFIFGTIGTILDLGGDLFEKIYGVVNDAWVWLKKKIPFLGDDDDDYEEKEPDEITKKAKAAAEAERSKTVKYQHENGTVLTVKATGKEARYIEAAKTPEERRQRVSETRRSHIQEDRLIEEARAGKKKYDIKKYVELKRKWEKEDAERNEKYAHEIDIPVTNFSGKESVMGFDDFKSTKENAEEYQKLMNEKKDDDAIRFAKSIKAKQDEEDAKRKSERDSALKKIEVGSSPDDLKLDAQRKASSVPAAMSAKLGVGNDDDNDDMGSNVDVTHLQEATQKGMNEWVDQHKPSKETQERIGTYITQLKEKAKKGTKEWIDKYNEWNEKNKPSKEEQARINAYNKAASEIDLSSAGLGTSAPGPEPVTPEKDKKKEEIPLYRRPENIAKYNAAAQNIDLSSAGLGLSAPGPDPSSIPAVAKAADDSSKKKDESKGKSGASGPTASPAAAPAASPSGEMPAPAPSSGETPASTPSSGGELNWIEKLISNTIQGAFKFGGAVVNAAKNGYNAAQQAFNGGGGIGSGAPFSGGNKAPGIGGRYGAIAGKRDELVLPLNQRAKGPDGKPMEWSQATNNPGNVGNTDQGGTFIFPDLQSGIKAQRDLLKERYSGGLTLRQMAMKYTPTMWREALPIWSSKSGIGTEEVPNLNDPAIMARLLKAIHIAEGSAKWVPQEEVDYALGLKPLPAGYKPKDYRQLTEKGKAFVAGGGSGADGGAGAPAGPLPNASPAVQKYLAIMERNTHGSRYEMSGRRDNPGIYDCSSFVSRSLREAGYKIPTPSPTTEDLGAVLKANGFQYYPLRMREGLTQAPPELQPGDILLNRGNGWHNHVETYWGNNKIVGAHSTRPEGRKNDEVSVKAFYSTGYPGFYRLVSASGGYAPNDLPPSGSVSKWNLVDPGYGQPGGSVQDLSVNSSTDLRWPTDSTVVNSGMGPRNPSDFVGAKGPISRQHGGTDIHAPSGSSIYSAMSGKIVGTSPNYGTVEIEHPDGWRSKYLHMKKFFVKAGQIVKAGDTIGEAGGIGKDGAEVFTPHLHFEMLKDGKKVDPEQVYAQNKSQTKGIGGPEFTPRINKQMNEYFENNGVGGPEISVKSDNRVIAELKKLQMIMIGVMKAAGKPSIAVSAPQEQGDPKSKGVDGGKFDNMTENMFSQLGGMLGDLNVATTGLGTQIA